MNLSQNKGDLTISNSTRGPVIALVDWNEKGHHLTFFSLYCKALLELGCRVAALCRDPDEMRKYLEQNGVVVQDDQIRFAALRFLNGPRFVRPRSLQTALRFRLIGRAFRRSLCEVSEAFQAPVDLCFFACLYERDVQLVQNMVAFCECLWSGLYLQANAFRSPGRLAPGVDPKYPFKSLLKHERLGALAVLDEGVVVAVEELMGKQAVVFPEVTDEVITYTHPLGQRLSRFAGSSKVVLLIGHLKPSKGVITFLKAAANAGTKDLVFAFVGEVIWSEFTAAEKQFLERAMMELPNAFFHCMRVPDEAAYNAVINSCDVLFAAYHDFPHSSNSLTKGSLLKKPMIVTDGSLMAERVQRYRLGETVPQDDVRAIVEVIRKITDDTSGWIEDKQPRWREYCEQHSFAAMVKAFSELLEVCAIKTCNPGTMESGM